MSLFPEIVDFEIFKNQYTSVKEHTTDKLNGAFRDELNKRIERSALHTVVRLVEDIL